MRLSEEFIIKEKMEEEGEGEERGAKERGKKDIKEEEGRKLKDT